MGKGIVKYRYVILAVFIALIAVSAAFLPTMINKVNYDLTSYLPDDYETSKGYAFLSETDEQGLRIPLRDLQHPRRCGDRRDGDA